MSFRNSLIGSLTTPYDGFREIFFYAVAVVITKSKVKLSLCKSLNSGFAEPYDGFR